MSSALHVARVKARRRERRLGRPYAARLLEDSPRLDRAMPASLPAPPAALNWAGGMPPSLGMMLNDRIGDCVAPDTPVLTESLRWLQAGDLSVGDRLLGFTEDTVRNAAGHSNGRYFATECIVERTDRVTRPCYRLIFDDGTVVVSSAGHRWLVRSQTQYAKGGGLNTQEWMRTEDLRCDDVNPHQVYKPVDVWHEDRSWDAGLLSGAFDGEGHITQSNPEMGRERRGQRVSFAQTDNAFLEQVRKSMKACGFEWVEKANDRHKILRVDGTPRKTLYSIEINQRANFLRFMGQIRPARLMSQFTTRYLGKIPGRTVRIIKKEFIGEQEVVMLDTSSRTYFANGLASHNCTCAAIGHAVQVMTFNADGHQGMVTIPDRAVLAAYEAITGYSPWTGQNNTGAQEDQVLAYWRQSGVGGHQIAAYGRVDHADNTRIKQAIELFGFVYIGTLVPRAWLTAPPVWDVQSGAAGRIAGGHAIIYTGWDDHGFELISWGKRFRITYAAHAAYVDETWGAISHDWIEADRRSPSGVDWAGLTSDLDQMDGVA